MTHAHELLPELREREFASYANFPQFKQKNKITVKLKNLDSFPPAYSRNGAYCLADNSTTR
jgi:hypothetical protein